MKTITIFIVAAALALGALGWFDTVAYRTLVASHRTAAQAPLDRLRGLEQADEERYRRCDAMRAGNRTSNTIDFTPEGRHCLIDALKQAASVEGTLVLVRNASVILSKQPDDQPVQAAALEAIGKARDTLRGQKAWLYDRPAQIAQAHMASVTLRLLMAPVPSPSFATQVMLLDQAEYSIHLPWVHQDQQIRRLESWLPAARAS